MNKHLDVGKAGLVLATVVGGIHLVAAADAQLSLLKTLNAEKTPGFLGFRSFE